MKVFLTGASGFIGQHLARHLADRGQELHVLVRRQSKLEPLQHPRIQLIEGDLLDAGSIAQAMEGCSEAYHLAGYARAWHKDRGTFYAINVEGTRNVLEAARRQGVRRVVVASTAGVLPPSENGTAVNEEGLRRPDLHTEYERTKDIAEKLALRYAGEGPEVVVVQPTKVFGPGPVDESNSATLMIREYLRGKWKIIPGNGKGVMDYVYVEDVAEGIRLAMEKGRPGKSYILGGDPLSYDDFFASLALLSGVRHRLIRLPVPLIMAFAAWEEFKAKAFGAKPLITPEWVRKIPFSWQKDSSRAREELGYTARPVEEGMKLAIDWLRRTDRL